jgi:hypothetical protein
MKFCNKDNEVPLELVVKDCDQKLASDSSGLSGGFRGIGRGFGL